MAAMQVNTRPAAIADAEAICNVMRRAITESCREDHGDDAQVIAAWLRNKTPANVATWMGEPGMFCIVALVDGITVGFGMAAAGEILLCYVLPECPGRGAGHALLQAIESQAATKGIVQLRLESTRTALGFYRRNGFSPSGPAMAAFGMQGQPMAKPFVTAALAKC